jgi:hypothetical protein
MIKVFLPHNNSNLIRDLSDEVLRDVVYRIFNTNEFIRENDPSNRRTGRFIKIVNDETENVQYVCFSNPNNNSRNAGLMQFVSPSYIEFYNDHSSDKAICIYVINPGSNDRTNYIKMFYRCFQTIGINILNADQLGIPEITSFVNYEDLKRYRAETSGRNIRNRQSYFIDDESQISLYGKTFGANTMESFIFALTLKKIADKRIVFYPVVDNNSRDISVGQRNVLTSLGVEFEDAIELFSSDGYAKPSRRGGSRNTPVFHYNLLKKFGEKRCYLCGCDMEHLIIGSHIERVSDIDRSAVYNNIEKARRSSDGDNGLWLCANHDKMFEYGIIYFEDYLLKINSIITNPEDQQFINKSIFQTRPIFSEDLVSVGEIEDDNFNIKQSHFNDNTADYINKHLTRIGVL